MYLAKHLSGFGIGLYLSAEIIQRHDGRILVESKIGKGSTFYFRLPLT
ncbi:ATP-binding protein [Mucilaginibacter sp. SP1R1]|nr:ATP-binding protein [Mucilaginibacter sp. SP1R1]